MGRWGPVRSEGSTYCLRVIKSCKSQWSQRLTSLEHSNGKISGGLLTRGQLS